MAKRKLLPAQNEAELPTKSRKGEDDDSEDSSAAEAESSEEESSHHEENDGLADMMSKILNQNVGAKIPVLAKRKTALMKDIEGVHKDNHDMRKLRAERRVERTKQMVTPDASTADFERQLKKLATRGVVALFNAIAKAKRETAAASEEVANAKKAVVAAARDDNSSIVSRDSTLIRSKAASAKEKKAAEEGSAEGADKGHKWAALRDDYMMGQKLTVKHWDKAAESDSE